LLSTEAIMRIKRNRFLLKWELEQFIRSFVGNFTLRISILTSYRQVEKLRRQWLKRGN